MFSGMTPAPCVPPRMELLHLTTQVLNTHTHLDTGPACVLTSSNETGEEDDKSEDTVVEYTPGVNTDTGTGAGIADASIHVNTDADTGTDADSGTDAGTDAGTGTVASTDTTANVDAGAIFGAESDARITGATSGAVSEADGGDDVGGVGTSTNTGANFDAVVGHTTLECDARNKEFTKRFKRSAGSHKHVPLKQVTLNHNNTRTRRTHTHTHAHTHIIAH